MITRFWAKNYKSLGDVDITLTPLTVFVGRNATGKSNLIDALRFLRDAVLRGLPEAINSRNGLRAIRHLDSKSGALASTITLGFEFDSSEVRGRYEFSLLFEDDSYQIENEAYQFILKADGSEIAFDRQNHTFNSVPLGQMRFISAKHLALTTDASKTDLRPVHQFLQGLRFYNLLPQEIASPQRQSDQLFLNEDGSNFGSMLYKLKTDHPHHFKNLIVALQNLLPNLHTVDVGMLHNRVIAALDYGRGKNGNQPTNLLDLESESDGTLRLLGMLTALYQQPAAQVLSFEEPELMLHPGALAVLWDEFEAASERSQILLTTHSPDLLNFCSADQIRVVELLEGQTVVGPLDEIQTEAIQERLFAPGELLRAQDLHRASDENNGSDNDRSQ
jgi:predicted ATPase